MRNARSRSASGILRALGSRILRPLGQVVQDRTELYLLVQFPPLVDGFLQASGDRQVGRLDDVPAIRVAHHWHRQTLLHHLQLARSGRSQNQPPTPGWSAKMPRPKDQVKRARPKG